MAYNPAILTSVLQARSLTRRGLSRRLGIGLQELEEELSRDPEPGGRILNSIANELSVPPFLFYMEEPPRLPQVLPDFRSENPNFISKSKSTVEAIQVAESIQRAALENNDVPELAFPDVNLVSNSSIEKEAFLARKFFNISADDQINSKNEHSFYLLCRKRIEERGIIVLHQSFDEKDGSGFCLSDKRQPVIVVNTRKQTRGRQLFTLIHELAHVLIGKSGISDPFIRKNSVERNCNRFAGSFLVPTQFVKELIGSRVKLDGSILTVVKSLANRLKISQEATALRLEAIGTLKPGSHAEWKALVQARGNPDFDKQGGGGKEPPTQDKVKLAKYGFRFAQVFSNLLDRGLITELKLYRISGLKPKYTRPYFSYAKSLTVNELQSMDLIDE